MILTKIYDLELGTLFLINNYVHVNVKIFSYFYHIFKKAKCPNFKKNFESLNHRNLKSFHYLKLK